MDTETPSQRRVDIGDPLPDELAAVLPIDPFEQLDIARRIAALAFSKRISSLEKENHELKGDLDENQSSNKFLENKVSDLELALRDKETKLTESLDEQARLVSERNALVANVKKLNRDVAKLEMFKRTLMKQLQDENEDDLTPTNSIDTTETPRNERILSIGSAFFAGSSNGKKLNSGNKNEAESEPPLQGLNEEGGMKTISSSSPATIRLSAMAKTASVPPTFSALNSEPNLPPTSPPNLYVRTNSLPDNSNHPLKEDDDEGHRSSRSKPPFATPPYSPHFTPAGTPPHGSAAGSPRRDPAKPRVDGREFFRQARGRLSYEQFSSFLANIKELNAHRQTREETLRRADEIFGPDNKDLFSAFEGLLSRHLPT